jgi:AraC-like DNA-binding protein
VAADHTVPRRADPTGQGLAPAPAEARRRRDACRPGAPVHTVAELARLADVSVRALQAIFHRHTGLAPMAYLRDLRLDRAHEDLLRARPA